MKKMLYPYLIAPMLLLVGISVFFGFTTVKGFILVRQYERGLSYMDHKHWAQARVNIEAVTRAQPKMASGHYNLGVCLLNEHEREAAITQFRQAIRLSPSYGAAHYQLGNALFAQGATPQARIEWSAAINSGDENVIALAQAQLNKHH